MHIGLLNFKSLNNKNKKLYRFNISINISVYYSTTINITITTLIDITFR